MPHKENINAIKNFAEKNGVYASLLDANIEITDTIHDVTCKELQEAIFTSVNSIVKAGRPTKHITHIALIKIIAGYFMAIQHPHYPKVYALLNKYQILKSYLYRLLIITDGLNVAHETFSVTQKESKDRTKLNAMFDDLMIQLKSHLPDNIEIPAVFVTHGNAMDKVDECLGYARTSCDLFEDNLKAIEVYISAIKDNQALADAFRFDEIATYFKHPLKVEEQENMPLSEFIKLINKEVSNNKGLRNILFRPALKELV